LKLESGSKGFPIWLIGDSPPKNWEDKLTEPLDPRHPARHNIWTPVLYGIQEQVFRADRRRVETTQVYVRNAAEKYQDKPSPTAQEWPTLADSITNFAALLKKHKPILVFTFGAFAFEFANRSVNSEVKHAFRNWSTKALGEEFRRSLGGFHPCRINIIPLLHASIARGKFLESHKYFTRGESPNYFDYVARQVAGHIIDHKNALDIWVKSHPNQEPPCPTA